MINTELTMRSQAPATTTLSMFLEKQRNDMIAFSQEQNISTVLMFSVYRQWAEENLQSPID